MTYEIQGNPNANCKCTGPGMCPRHGVVKSRRKFNLCAGIDCTPAQCEKYWNAWERGVMAGQSKPAEKPMPVALSAINPNRSRGFGDFVASGINFLTMGMIRPCGGCTHRQAILNHWFPATRPPIERVDLSEARRHLMFHIWPVSGNGIWQWHCDQLLKNAALWNGRRIIAIVTSAETDCVDDVKRYLGDFTDDYIFMPNNSGLREVVTWMPMLMRLRSFDTPQDVTFSGQSKCVRLAAGALNDETQVTLKWTRAMYETCMRWDCVRPILEEKATAGSFFQPTTPSVGGWGPWLYSGSFFWFRNHDAFRRNWEYVPQVFFGTEAWAGHLFHPDEAGVIAANEIGGWNDIYKMEFWNRVIEPQMEKWRAEHNA